MALRLLNERFVPIKKRLICNPFLPANLIDEKPLNSGKFEFKNIASKKNTIK